MITINRIRQIPAIDSCCTEEYDVFFCGKAIDERTNTVLNQIKVTPNYAITFDKTNYSITIGSTQYKIFRLQEFFISSDISRVLIDSTSLGFPELLYLLDAMNKSGKHLYCTIIYVEPKEYAKEVSKEGDDEFVLSDKRYPFIALPAFALDNQSNSDDKATLVSFLGFENSRLGHILEHDDGASYKQLLAHLAIPAYKAGWENISLKRHMKYFNMLNSELITYPGSNPYAVNELLNDIISEHNKIVITSLGTKPTAIGICVFLINNISKNNVDNQIGAIYDFPEKSANRSKGIGQIYSYELEIYN